MKRLRHLHWLLLLAAGVTSAATSTPSAVTSTPSAEAGSFSQKLFKCTGKDGSITVSNTPCAKGATPDAALSSGGSKASSIVYKTPCERVADKGFSLVEIRSKLTPAQVRALEAEDFGRMNSAGASRILAERRDNGLLRVCAFFSGGDHIETVIESDGLVRRDGVVDSADPAARQHVVFRDGLSMCSERIDACISGQSAIGVGFEQCVRTIPVCSAEVASDCCPQACIAAYWKPPYEHIAGLASMKATPACKSARGIQH